MSFQCGFQPMSMNLVLYYSKKIQINMLINKLELCLDYQSFLILALMCMKTSIQSKFFLKTYVVQLTNNNKKLTISTSIINIGVNFVAMKIEISLPVAKNSQKLAVIKPSSFFFGLSLLSLIFTTALPISYVSTV